MDVLDPGRRKCIKLPAAFAQQVLDRAEVAFVKTHVACEFRPKELFASVYVRDVKSLSVYQSLGSHYLANFSK